jgi:branched-chain amino acid transport system permease protein
VWICYAELVMLGMYTVYFLNVTYGVPILLASLGAVVMVAFLGALLHYLVIRPVLQSEPINQLLVTGGVLFFLQSFATLLFGIEFRNLGLKLPILNIGEMYFSYARVLAFLVALAGMVGLYLFLTRTFLGTAIRAIAQDREIMPLMGVDSRKLYLVTSAIGGGLAGLAACLLVLQYDVHPAIGLTFGPITFMICVLGGLGNMIGGFVAAFIISQFISIGGFFFHIEWGYVIAFAFFILTMFVRPQGLFGK